MQELNQYRTESGAIDWQKLVEQVGLARKGDTVTINHWPDMGKSRVAIVKWIRALVDMGVTVNFEAVANNVYSLYDGHSKWIEAEKTKARAKGRKQSGNKGGAPQTYNNNDILRIYDEVAAGSVTLDELPHLYCAVSTLHRRACKLGLSWPPQQRKPE